MKSEFSGISIFLITTWKHTTFLVASIRDFKSKQVSNLHSFNVESFYNMFISEQYTGLWHLF